MADRGRVDTLIKAVVWVGGLIVVICLGVFGFLFKYGNDWAAEERAWQAEHRNDAVDGVSSQASGTNYHGLTESTVFPVRQEAEPQIRISRTLTDNKGRQISVVVTGRTANSVLFEGNGKDWEWPISQLSREDQQFVRALPIVSQ